MKKLVASLLGICSMVAYVNAQGVFNIDTGANFGNGSSSSATTGGLVWLNGVLDTTQDINLGVLWGTSSASVTTALNIDPSGLNTGAYASSGNWIASQASGQGDMTSYGGGAIFDPNGLAYAVPGQAAGTTLWFVIQGWTGNSATYAGATGAGVLAGQTGPFSITIVDSKAPSIPNTAGMSALNLVTVPEPSVLALSGIGAAALMLVRRKK